MNLLSSPAISSNSSSSSSSSRSEQRERQRKQNDGVDESLTSEEMRLINSTVLDDIWSSLINAQYVLVIFVIAGSLLSYQLLIAPYQISSAPDYRIVDSHDKLVIHSAICCIIDVYEIHPSIHVLVC